MVLGTKDWYCLVCDGVKLNKIEKYCKYNGGRHCYHHGNRNGGKNGLKVVFVELAYGVKNKRLVLSL